LPRRLLRPPLRVQIAPDGEEHQRPGFLGYAGNLSATGIFIQCVNPRADGTVISLLVHVPGVKDPLCCDAEVRWFRNYAGKMGPSAGMGLRLIDPSDETQSFLRRLCSSDSVLPD
jgi:hypothetical protein